MKSFKEVLQFNDDKGSWICEMCGCILAGKLDLDKAVLENKGNNRQQIKVYGGIIFRAHCRNSECKHLNEFWTLRFAKKAIRKVIAKNVFGTNDDSLLPKDLVEVKINYPKEVYDSLAKQTVDLTEKAIKNKLWEK